MILKYNSKVYFHWDVNDCNFLPRMNIIYAGNNIDGRIFLRCNLREENVGNISEFSLSTMCDSNTTTPTLTRILLKFL